MPLLESGFSTFESVNYYYLKKNHFLRNIRYHTRKFSPIEFITISMNKGVYFS